MRFVHLAGLWALAAVQPLFSVLAEEPAFFVARDNTAGDILIFAFGWTLVPPLLAYGVVRVLGRPAHLAFIAVLGALLILPLLSALPPVLAFGLALLGGAAAAALYAAKEPARTFVSILGIAPVVVLALLFLSPVGELVRLGGNSAVPDTGPVPDPKPVVLVLFDELPITSLMTADEELDVKRFPNFARLAAGSTWYRNATSVADGTYVAVPALLTGVRPQAELPSVHRYPKNLFALVGREYDHHVYEPLTSVCQPRLCGPEDLPSQGERLRDLARDLSVVERTLLLPDDLADDLPVVDQDFEDFEADADVPVERLKAGRAIVDSMRANERGLWMVHFVVPHVPWRFLPDGSQYPVLGPQYPGLDGTTWGDDGFLLAQAEQRHELMTRFADRLLGEVIDQLERSGLWDDALVMVVADHGGNIEPGELRRNVAPENFAQTAGIPFFVRTPGQQRGAVSEEFVTLLDVMPTVAKELDIATDWEFDGVPVDEPREVELLQQRNGPDAELIDSTPAGFLAQRSDDLASRLERLPSLWAAGPRQDLVGRPLSDLTRADPGDWRGFLNNAPLYAQVDPDSGVIPAYVTGATTNVPPGTDLIVAIDGTIQASGEAYEDRGDPRFSMIVRPGVLTPGGHRVEVLAVEGQTARPLVSTG